MSFAHRAVQMGPTSPYAHRAYGYLNSRLGNTDEAIRWMRKAYELNPYDLGMAAAYGYGLIFAGRYSEGPRSSGPRCRNLQRHPTWWDFGLFVGAFMLGDNRPPATAESLRTTTTKSHYLAARLIGAKVAGRDQLAGQPDNEIDRQVSEIRRQSARDLRRPEIPRRPDRRLVRGPARRRPWQRQLTGPERPA